MNNGVTKNLLPFLLLALAFAVYFEFGSVETFDPQVGRGGSVWRFSLPSAEDWRKVRYHRLYEKHLSDTNLMNRFFMRKGIFDEEEEDFVLMGPDD